LPKAQAIAEPVGRNTAPAIGLAAFLLLREDPDAVIGMFPSDQVIADEKNYRATIERGVRIAAAGENIVVLGIRGRRARKPATATLRRAAPPTATRLRVRRFTEKPNAENRCGFRGCEKLFLEQRYVPVECSHAGQCAARASSPTAPYWSKSPRFRHGANLQCDFPQALSEMRKHQR
jgi:hypothetical protein